MFKGNWRRFAPLWIAFSVLLLAVALWLVWNESANLTEQRIRSEQSIQSHIEYAEDAIDRECLSLESMALRDCIYENIETARDHNRSEQDLDAQQQMALFTRVMGYTAVGGLVVGVVSIIAIFLTLKATQDMARDARQIGRIESRAYVIVTDAHYIVVNSGIGVEFHLKNIGKTPARIARVKGRLRFHFGIGAITEISEPRVAFCDFEAFGGVVEPDQATRAFGFVPHTEFKKGFFLDHIIGNETGDTHCDISWADVFDQHHSERHILTKDGGKPTTMAPLNPQDTRVDLFTAYTGKHRSQEEGYEKN